MLVATLLHTILSSPAHELAEAERSFSRRFNEVGFKQSFLEFFAPGSISFTPDPGDARKRLEAEPPDKLPDPNSMVWEPVRSDVSRGGDYGYTTGPLVITERATGKKVGHGYYMSVWQKQPDGQWKVKIDMGSGMRSAWPEQPFLTFEPEAPRGVRGGVFPEAAYNEISSTKGIHAAAAQFGHPTMRLHRSGTHAYENLDSVTRFLARTPAKWKWTVTGSDYAPAKDMGFTYGSFDADGAKGFFTRVWKLNSEGEWKVAMQVEALPRPRPAEGTAPPAPEK